MDTLTHALSGALVARATAPRAAARGALARRLAAGFLACAFPDLDFVAGFLGPVEYLRYHRGVTHSLVLLPLWALALAWLLAKLLREPGGWRALYGVCALGIGAHIAGDWITSFGTMVLAPLSDRRAALGVTFIIDLWFSAIVVAGLLASLLLRRSRLPAAAALAALVGYVSWQWTLKEEALEFGRRWAEARGLREASVSAYPRPVSPFNWTVIVSDAETHHFAHVNLRRTAAREPRPGDGLLARLDAAYRPLADARWERRGRYGDTDDARMLAREAAGSPALAFFRWFAEAPAADGVAEGSDCIGFLDLRFVTPGREFVPFRFEACRERPGAPWRAFRRDGAGVRVPVN
ncbi:MAG: metal-dependent hydrolase [Burkholderiales bacterium]|nr:metal-dependent hydrolase [Burkholderiales bacterium]